MTTAASSDEESAPTVNQSRRAVVESATMGTEKEATRSKNPDRHPSLVPQIARSLALVHEGMLRGRRENVELVVLERFESFRWDRLRQDVPCLLGARRQVTA